MQEPELDLEGTCMALRSWGSQKTRLFVSKETGSGGTRDDNHMGPRRQFFSRAVFQSRVPFSHRFFFFPLSVNNSIAQFLHPLPQQLWLRAAWWLQRAAAAFRESSIKYYPPPPDSFSPKSSKKTSKAFYPGFYGCAVVSIFKAGRGGGEAWRYL